MAAHLRAAPADATKLSGNSSSQPCSKATHGARQPAPRAWPERPPPLRLSLPSGRDRRSVAARGGPNCGPMMPSAPTTRGREHLGCVRGQPIIARPVSTPPAHRPAQVATLMDQPGAQSIDCRSKFRCIPLFPLLRVLLVVRTAFSFSLYDSQVLFLRSS